MIFGLVGIKSRLG